MVDRLYADQQHLGDDDLVAQAAALKLDLGAFGEALANPALLARVQGDREVGERRGVTHTPTFFVDGTRHDGPWSDLLRLLPTRPPSPA